MSEQEIDPIDPSKRLRKLRPMLSSSLRPMIMVPARTFPEVTKLRGCSLVLQPLINNHRHSTHD